MLMSMTTLPISGVSFLVCGLARICLNGEALSSIACSRRANAFVKPARCSSRSSALGNPLWTIVMRVLPSVARELRQQPGEAALDGAERAMEQHERRAVPMALVVHVEAIDLGVAVSSVVAHPVQL